MKVIVMVDRKMNAEIGNKELYHQLEPEANEIMFGQRTLPERPLTDKEVSKRKKIILKLVDQKLKFQLIDLMGQMIEAKESSKIASPSITTEYKMDNSMDFSSESSYRSFRNWSSYAHQGLQNSEHNCQPQFQTEWQSSIYPQQYESSYNPSLLSQHYNFQEDIEHTSQVQKRYAKQSLKRFRNQPNPNLVCPPISTSLNMKPKSSTSEDQIHKANESSWNSNTVTKVSQSLAEEVPLSTDSNQFQYQDFKSYSNGHLPINQFNQSTCGKELLATKQLPGPSNTGPLCKTSPRLCNISMTSKSQFFNDHPMNSNVNWFDQTNVSIYKQELHFPLPSNSRADKSSANNLQPLFKTDDLCQRKNKRKRRRFGPSKRQRLKLNQSQEGPNKVVDTKTNAKVESKPVTTVNIQTVTKVNIETGSKVNINDTNIVTSNIATAGSKQCFGNVSTEWNMMNKLVTSICRNNLNLCEPLSPSELKLKNEMLIQVSINPISIRSNAIVARKIGEEKLEHFINECKNILSCVSLTDPEVKLKFSQSRDDLIKSLKALNAQCISLNEAENYQLAQIKIQNIIDPILNADPDNLSKSSIISDNEVRNKLIIELMKNPHALEDNEMVKERNINKIDVMREIKYILDEFIAVRPSKSFYIPLNCFVDIPFAVELLDKSGKITEENANLVSKVLHNLIEDRQPKPKIIEEKFVNGSLILVCANRLSFEWIKKTISADFDGKWAGADLSVSILPVKNVIPKNALKTICLKFKDPQFFHFNNLMEQLKINNPRLLTRRWDLRTPRVYEVVDSTKCIYVGVDIESLVVLEEMNRVGVLGKSLVYFEITYNDNEENFEVNFVNEK